MMKHAIYFFSLAITSVMMTPALAAENNRCQSTGPNIVVILADDLGYGDLGCYGSKDVRTPAVDQLAAAGIRFNNFYANCPVCSPTRAALLSGCYQERVGVPGVIRTHAENSWGNLTDDSVLLPEILQTVGYETAIVGKWHLGLEASDWPTRKGFAYFKGFLGDMMDDYYDHLRHGNNYMREGEREIVPEGHATDLFTSWAIEFLQTRAAAKDSRPFFLYLAYNAPHTPIQPPQQWLDKVRARKPQLSEKRAKLVALIEHLDDGIGKFMQALETNGFAENTVVFFTSDNGGQINVGANNGPHRAGKGTMYEGGLKVPAIGWWPGTVEPGTSFNGPLMTMDLFATVGEIANADWSAGVDSRSFLNVLKGQSPAVSGSRDLFFLRREGGQQFNGLGIRALRRGNWKLVQNRPDQSWELYNLERDPLEQTDLAKTNVKVFRELCAAMRKQIQIGGQTPWQ
jgi:arylsulfatase A-like enzyme